MLRQTWAGSRPSKVNPSRVSWAPGNKLGSSSSYPVARAAWPRWSISWYSFPNAVMLITHNHEVGRRRGQHLRTAVGNHDVVFNPDPT